MNTGTIYSKEQIIEALENSWPKETCWEKQQEVWNTDQAEIGQCSVSSLIIQDYLGGDLIKAKTENGISHFWNLTGGVQKLIVHEISFLKRLFL